MAQDNNQPKEEKDFFAREEIKTMEKDTSKLRETEARQEREKVSQIKTEEEIAREREREALARQSALERDLAEKEAEEREKRVRMMKEEREAKESALTQINTKRAATATGEFQGALRETQTREEEERKRFLDRIEAKAEGRETPAIKPTEKLPEITKTSFKKPGLGQKLWIRIILSLFSLSILAPVVTFWYWYFNIRTEPTPTPVETIETGQKLIVIPDTLIATETFKILEVSALGQTLKDDLGDKQFTRLIIEDQKKNKILNLKEFFETLGVKTPETFYDKLNNDPTLFIYSAQGVNRLGLIAQVKEADLMPLLKVWESTMEQDLEPLAALLGKTGLAPTPDFKEAIYRDTVFRYLSFPPEGLGICWAVTDNYFILTFSGESIIKTIDKIK